MMTWSYIVLLLSITEREFVYCIRDQFFPYPFENQNMKIQSLDTLSGPYYYDKLQNKFILLPNNVLGNGPTGEQMMLPVIKPVEKPSNKFPDNSFERMRMSQSVVANLPYFYQGKAIIPPFASQEEYLGSVVDITNNFKSKIVKQPPPMLQPGIPPFLKETPPEVHQKFLQIVTNQNDSFNGKQKKLDDLISRLDKKNQIMYEQYRKSKEIEEKERRARIHALVATMSYEAQAAFAKISAILMNPEVKDGERQDLLRKTYSRIDNRVKNEFNRRFPELV